MISRNHPSLSPVESLNIAMDAAREGRTTNISTPSLLRSLHLDGDKPDGRTIMDRFLNGDRGVSALRAFVLFGMGTVELIHATNDRIATPQQEELAKTLGQVVARQITREGDICDGARDIAQMSTRDDIISPDVRAALGTPEPLEIVYEVVYVPSLDPPMSSKSPACCPPFLR